MRGSYEPRNRITYKARSAAAAAVVVTAGTDVVAATATSATCAEQDDENKYDPDKRVVTKAISTHKIAPFCRCARLIKFFPSSLRRY